MHRARFSQSVDLLFRLEADFFGPARVRQRSQAAANLIKNPDDFLETEGILDFFETIAMLTRRKALDIYVVWHTFNYWIEHYYAAASDFMRVRQATEPGVWEDLAWLMPKVDALTRKRLKQSSVVTPQDIASFLREEAAEA